MAATLTPYFNESSNNCYTGSVEQLANINFFEPILGRPINVGDVIIFFAFVSGVHFNLHNILSAFFETDAKGYGLKAMIPYAQFFGMLFISSYSRLWT